MGQIVVETQAAALHVEEQRVREHGGVADGVVVVEPVRAAARDLHAVDFTGEVVAFFAPEVADESSVGPVLRRPFVIDSRQLQVVAVGPRLLGKEVVRKVSLRGLVRRGKVIQDIARDWVDAILGDDVPGERIAGHDTVDQPALAGSKICTPIASSSEKSPRRIRSLGTELVTVSIVSSCSFS